MHILELPAEIRAHIWSWTFRGAIAHTDANNTTYTDPEYCEPCHRQPLPPDAQPLSTLILPLLTNRQIHAEALPHFHTHLNLYLDSEPSLQPFLAVVPKPLAANLRTLTLTSHIDIDNCLLWNDSLSKLCQRLARLSLTRITMHHHMQPPSSYEHLWPGIYYVAPLLKQPHPPPRPIAVDLRFDYRADYVMFQSPFLGEVMCSDALQEHEMVLRELLEDGQFRAGVEGERDEDMTLALERVARKHERSWFRSLQRRRMDELSPEMRAEVERALEGDEE